MASVAAKHKTLEQKRFFSHKNDSSQSLMVTDDALKLDYASVIFVDPEFKSIKPNLNFQIRSNVIHSLITTIVTNTA